MTISSDRNGIEAGSWQPLITHIWVVVVELVSFSSSSDLKEILNKFETQYYLAGSAGNLL